MCITHVQKTGKDHQVCIGTNKGRVAKWPRWMQPHLPILRSQIQGRAGSPSQQLPRERQLQTQVPQPCVASRNHVRILAEGPPELRLEERSSDALPAGPLPRGLARAPQPALGGSRPAGAGAAPPAVGSRVPQRKGPAGTRSSNKPRAQTPGPGRKGPGVRHSGGTPPARGGRGWRPPLGCSANEPAPAPLSGTNVIPIEN